MLKRFLIIFTCLFTITTFAQSLLSPEQFLGYKIGTKYTRHHKIVEYVKYLAAAKKEMVVTEQYGFTNEGRELMLVYISSSDNIRQLENIRKNNLRITGVLKDEKPNNNNAPAIVWLSYNVHGNEPSSSEAALETLYQLVTSNNTQAQQWLKNTVVIIDPCLNPDGRDRYVNWYNQVASQKPDADPQSREHNEPWPGGRTNHYNFDLNRDWAWQTQVETQQRIKKYNQWMPHVHVDFHEQGFNEPYYFAPAAEPLHEVITAWQKDFQTTIGRNHAKYFDKNGWLYFTKERFDIFYPSYGDSYPMFNGSIGMTYEQAGHSRGGLAVQTREGDTLTLVDRVAHHYTTGLSTVEIASLNNTKIVTEFAKYFNDANEGKNALYKTFILTSENEQKINALKKLLIANDILFGTINNTTLKGFNYNSLKEEDVKISKYTIAVSACQPKGVLATVLLEPKSKLNDSATYDITAWSLPYAFGVEAYAIKDKKEINYAVAPLAVIRNYISDYGFLISYNSLTSVKALLALQKQGVKVRMAMKPFMYKNKQYERGTLIAIKKLNDIQLLNKAVNNVCEELQIEADIVETGFMDKGADFGSPDVVLLSNKKVALLTGEGASSGSAGEIWNFFDKELNYPLTLLYANDLNRVNLKNYHTLIIPDGYYKGLNDKSIAEKVKDFVKNGGKLVVLEGAANQLANAGDWGIKLKGNNEDDKSAKTEYAALKKFADSERDFLTDFIPGAIYKVELDNTHPLAFGYTNTYYTLKQNTDIYEFLNDGWNVGVLKKDNYITGFGGYKAKGKLKDGTVIGSTDMGNGAVVFFAEDPIFRMFWENGKLLLCNAIFL